MQVNPKLAVVLLEAEELASNFDGWPDTICLAVCLLPVGDHHFIVYHVNESREICARLIRRLGLNKDELLVFPEVDGFQTRPVLFSELQAIWSLVAGAPEAVEEAVDYAGNYQFAVEEGLDPLEFLGVIDPAEDENSFSDSTPLVWPPVRMVRQKSSSKSAVPWFFSRHSPKGAPDRTLRRAGVGLQKAQIWPSFLQPENARPRPDFFSLVEYKKQQPEIWIIKTEEEGWITIEQPENLGGELVVDSENQVFLSEESFDLAFRLTGRDKVLLPARIKLCATILPEHIRSWLSAAGKTKVRLRGHFLYVSCHELSLSVGGRRGMSAEDQLHEPQAGNPASLSIYRESAWTPAKILCGDRRHLRIAATAVSLLIVIYSAVGLTGNALAEADSTQASKNSVSAAGGLFGYFARAQK